MIAKLKFKVTLHNGLWKFVHLSTLNTFYAKKFFRLFRLRLITNPFIMLLLEDVGASTPDLLVVMISFKEVERLLQELNLTRVIEANRVIQVIDSTC